MLQQEGNVQDAADFVSTVFGDPFPDTLRVQLWSLAARRTHTATSAAEAARVAAEHPDDLYIAVGYAGTKIPASRRAKATEVAGIAALWVDLDVNGGPEQKTGAFASADDAIDTARRLAEPTVIVDSGYGVHAWWVLQEPWLFSTPASRESAQRLARQWQDAARVLAPGVRIDATHDLARILRIPGTVNRKGGKAAAVRLLDASGPLWPAGALRERAEGLGVPVPLLPAPRSSRGAGAAAAGVVWEGGADDPIGTLVIDADADPPFERFEALMENHPDFARTWRHERRLPGNDQSASAYDMSLANYAAHAGWTPQEIATLVIAHHRKHDRASGKHARPDYIAATVRKAVERREREAERQVLEEEREAAVAELGRLQDEEEVVADVAVDLFNQVVASGQRGAPRVTALRQFGREEDKTRYVLRLEDGREVQMTPSGLIDPRSFQRALMTATGHVMAVPKQAEWTAAIRVLLRCAETVEDEDDTQIGELVDALNLYTLHSLRARREDDAVESRSPFLEEGRVYVHVPSLLTWMQATRLTWKKPDLLAALRRAGFVRETVAFSTHEGSRSSASYYAGPASLLATTERAARTA